MLCIPKVACLTFGFHVNQSDETPCNLQPQRFGVEVNQLYTEHCNELVMMQKRQALTGSLHMCMQPWMLAHTSTWSWTSIMLSPLIWCVKVSTPDRWPFRYSRTSLAKASGLWIS